jgi:hypothetical protein
MLGNETKQRAERQLPQDIIAVVDRSRDLLLRQPEPQSHFVQFYGTEDNALNRNVGFFMAEGLKLGGALVIGTAERNREVAREISKIGIDAEEAVAAGKLCFLEAEATLAQFMVDSQPYWRRFESTIGSAINKIQNKVGHSGLRAYGEMVGVLWTNGQFSAAVRLEQFWNRLLSRSSASLYCGYPIDILSPGFQGGAVEAVLCAHSHVLPCESSHELGQAVHLAIRAVLGPAAGDYEPAMTASRLGRAAPLPTAEADVLWIRKNLPERASEILAQARQYLLDDRNELCA